MVLKVIMNPKQQEVNSVEALAGLKHWSFVTLNRTVIPSPDLPSCLSKHSSSESLNVQLLDSRCSSSVGDASVVGSGSLEKDGEKERKVRNQERHFG